jgi:hypothetical protein
VRLSAVGTLVDGSILFAMKAASFVCDCCFQQRHHRCFDEHADHLAVESTSIMNMAFESQVRLSDLGGSKLLCMLLHIPLMSYRRL